MARVVNLESGWLTRQLDTASQRASELPQWLTRANDRDRRVQETRSEKRQNADQKIQSE